MWRKTEKLKKSKRSELWTGNGGCSGHYLFGTVFSHVFQGNCGLFLNCADKSCIQPWQWEVSYTHTHTHHSSISGCYDSSSLVHGNLDFKSSHLTYNFHSAKSSCKVSFMLHCHALTPSLHNLMILCTSVSRYGSKIRHTSIYEMGMLHNTSSLHIICNNLSVTLCSSVLLKHQQWLLDNSWLEEMTDLSDKHEPTTSRLILFWF